MTNKYEWISCYIYIDSAMDLFLLNSLKPLVKSLFINKKINNFFFIRYFENGPHIRLRLKLNEKNITEVKLIVQEEFSNYLSRHSYHSENEDLKVSNYISFNKYEPEIDRYGGRVAISIAEKQFEISSKVVLEIINNNNWCYENAIINALYLHISFVHSFKLNKGEAINFFKLNFDNWTTTANNTSNRAVSVYETYFQKNKENILSKLKLLWIALNEENIFEEDWMNSWILEMSTISNELLKVVRKDSSKFLFILESYVHMTNNRIGVKNVDEPFISYLSYRSLENIIND